MPGDEEKKMLNDEYDLSKVANIIWPGVCDWLLLRNNLDQNDVEDCSGQIADDLHDAGLLSIASLDGDCDIS